jgi:hypothetical protein
MATNDERPGANGANEELETLQAIVTPEWLTRKQCARYLQVSLPTLDRVKPPRHMVGASPRFRKTEIDQWLAAKGGAP